MEKLNSLIETMEGLRDNMDRLFLELEGKEHLRAIALTSSLHTRDFIAKLRKLKEEREGIV